MGRGLGGGGQIIFKARRRVRVLTRMRRTPTRRIMVFAGRILQSFAAKGAAIMPPRIRPAMMGRFSSLRKKKKVRACVRVTKNSAIFTEPMT